MFLFQRLSLFVSILSVLTTLPATAWAGDTCSPADIIQPAIDEAAIAAACNVDGSYVSPQLLADRVMTECSSQLDTKRCKRCVIEGALRSAVTARTLVREGFFNSGAVLVTLQAIYKYRDQLCN